MMIIATNLQAYAHNSDKDYDEMMEADQELLDLLGPRTPVKAWLTTSLD
jgi:hypothetical protein